MPYPFVMKSATKRRGRPAKVTGKTGWEAWPDRFRAHMRDVGLTQTKLGEEMGKRLRDDKTPYTQAAVGHWLTGHNELTLSQFFALCEAAKADPMLILFEKHIAHAAVDWVRAGASQVIGLAEPRAPSATRGPIGAGKKNLEREKV